MPAGIVQTALALQNGGLWCKMIPRHPSARSNVAMSVFHPGRGAFPSGARLVWLLAVLVGWALPAQSPAASGPPQLGGLRLRPGDAVRLEIKDEPALSGQFPVGADGRLLLPLVGFVVVEGREFGDLAAEVEARYAGELADPVIRLTPLVRVAVLGEVRIPGLYPVDPTFTVADALAQAGGLLPTANRGKIQLVRGGEVVLAKLDPRSETLRLAIRSGDQIVVPRRGWISENTPILIGAAASVLAALVTSLILR